jgi:hypothetical protein
MVTSETTVCACVAAGGMSRKSLFACTVARHRVFHCRSQRWAMVERPEVLLDINPYETVGKVYRYIA